LFDRERQIDPPSPRRHCWRCSRRGAARRRRNAILKSALCSIVPGCMHRHGLPQQGGCGLTGSRRWCERPVAQVPVDACRTQIDCPNL
jgi:hypothetical protein